MPSHDEARLRDARAHAIGEVDLEALAMDAIEVWLAHFHAAILRELGNTPRTLTAAAWPESGADDAIARAAENSVNAWVDEVGGGILPRVEILFGEAFQQARRADPGSGLQYQLDYMESVADRLRIWPTDTFEELRPELLELISDADSIEAATDRIGSVLRIDAPTRAIRAQIRDVDAALAVAPDPALRAKRSALWDEHRDSLGQWRWKARRIARTETHGAIVGGQLARARHDEDESGEPLFKRWLATDDVRVRPSHAVADGQIVELGQRFRVGGFLLDAPGVMGGPDADLMLAPHEIINCRCSLVILDADDLQDELNGPDANSEPGEGNVRMGPDDPDAADAAMTEIAEELGQPVTVGRRGEDVGQTPDPVRTAVAADPDHQPDTDLVDAGDLTEVPDEELEAYAEAAANDENDLLYRQIMDELDARDDARRAAARAQDDADAQAARDEIALAVEDTAPLDDTEWPEDEPAADDVPQFDAMDDDELAEWVGTEHGAAALAEVNARLIAQLEDPDAAASGTWMPERLDAITEDTELAPWDPGYVEPDGLTDLERALENVNTVMMDPDATDDAIAAAIEAADAAEAEENRITAASLADDERRAAIAADDPYLSEEEIDAIMSGFDADREGMRMYRREQFINQHAKQYGTRSFDRLMRAVHMDEVVHLVDELEAANAGGSAVLKPYDQSVDPVYLFYCNYTTVLKYASEDSKRWFDENGRVTLTAFREMILSGSPRPPVGQDYLQ